MLKERKVGLNYEAIEDKEVKATISYGYFNWDTSASSTFENTSPAVEWSLDIESISYGKDIIPNDGRALTKAVIDSNIAEI